MSRVRITTIFFLVSVFCFGSFLTGGDECLAEEKDIIINEIGACENSNYEWVEIYNRGDEAVEITEWYFMEGVTESDSDGENHGLKLYPDGDLKIEIGAGEYAIITKDAEKFLKAYPDYRGILIDSSWGTLKDAGEEIALRNKSKNNIEIFSYFACSKFSLERANPLLDDYLENNWREHDLGNTLGEQNSNYVESGGGLDDEDKNDEEDNEEEDEAGDGDGEPTPNLSQGGNSGNDNFDIIITELVLNPEDDDRENEFIEIYNQGDAEVNIGGWMMEDKLGGRITQFIFPENTILSSKEYRVFYRPETKITLNNSGDGVILKNSDGKIIDETDESGAALEDWSWSRNEDGEWEWSLTPTAGEENKIEIGKLGNSEIEDEDEELSSGYPELSSSSSSFDYLDEIVISEIFSNPEGRDNQNGNYEWIELYNFSDQKINLRGWQIDDIIDGGSGAYFIEGDLEISARSYLTLDYSRTKIVLNNNGDEVNLLDPDGKVISNVVYEKGGEEGWSYARSEKELSSGYPELSSFSDSFMWSDLPTPGKENIGNWKLDIEEEYEEEIGNGELEIKEEYSKNNPRKISITEAKKLARYSWVKIKGTVSAPTGVFGEKTIYLSGSGIQVYSHQEDLPDLRAGDVVELTGRVSEIGGEKRILLSRADDLKIVGYQEEPEPMIILTGETAEPIEGYLVTVEGKVTQTSGNVFYLDDGSGEVKIYIKPSTGIKKPSIKKGDWMAITGQVSRTSAGYRILPRFQDDIRAGRVSGISASLTEAGSSPLLVVLILIGVMVLGDWGRIKLNRITNHES